jgi:hypothetical protein
VTANLGLKRSGPKTRAAAIGDRRSIVQVIEAVIMPLAKAPARCHPILKARPGGELLRQGDLDAGEVDRHRVIVRPAVSGQEALHIFSQGLPG